MSGSTGSESMRTQWNLFVAAVADESCFVHTAPGGNLERLKARVTEWGIPIWEM